MKKIAYILLFIFFSVLAFVLHLKNPDTVLFSFPFIEIQAPLGLLMLVSALIGVVVGAILMSVSVFRSKLSSSQSKRKLAKVEKEVENLRAMPINDNV